MYYAALGKSAASRKEAVYGAVLGTCALMLAILLMNTAILSNIGEAGSLGIPTLYLAKEISYGLGAVFSIILICGIFSACSAMLWKVSERFVRQGSVGSYVFAGGVSLAGAAALCGADRGSISLPRLYRANICGMCGIHAHQAEKGRLGWRA